MIQGAKDIYFADDFPDKMLCKMFLVTVIGDKMWFEHSPIENLKKNDFIIINYWASHV